MATIKKYDIENVSDEDVAEWLMKFTDIELEKLMKGLQHEVKDRNNRRVEAAKAEIEASLEKQGLTLADVFGAKRGPKSGTTIAPKYRNPVNPDETWTGRGKQPNWLSAIVADMSHDERAAYLEEITI